jgi:hypothetical protein
VLFYNPLTRTTQKTQHLTLRRRVYWSLCCTRTLRGSVFTVPLPRNRYTRHDIYYSSFSDHQWGKRPFWTHKVVKEIVSARL